MTYVRRCIKNITKEESENIHAVNVVVSESDHKGHNLVYVTSFMTLSNMVWTSAIQVPKESSCFKIMAIIY